MNKSKKVNKTITQVEGAPLQVISIGLTEKDAKEVQSEIAKRLTSAFATLKPCEATAMRLTFAMLEHNIVTLDRLIEILQLGNALIQWDEKSQGWMIQPSLMKLLERKT